MSKHDPDEPSESLKHSSGGGRSKPHSEGGSGVSSPDQDGLHCVPPFETEAEALGQNLLPTTGIWVWPVGIVAGI